MNSNWLQYVCINYVYISAYVYWVGKSNTFVNLYNHIHLDVWPIYL